MPSLLFNNLMNMKIFNNRRIAIYYLNNLSPNHTRFDLDDKDFIKEFIATGFISASEIKDDIINHFHTNLKNKPYVQKLAKDHFIHQPNSHTFEL
jgi:hypothetical protein